MLFPEEPFPETLAPSCQGREKEVTLGKADLFSHAFQTIKMVLYQATTQPKLASTIGKIDDPAHDRAATRIRKPPE